MKIIGAIAALEIGVLAILGACSSPAKITPSTPAPAPVVVTSPKQANFITTNLRFPNYAESIYDTVEVNVTVTNTGEQQGTFPVVLKIDGSVAQTQNVTLAGGASKIVVFNLPFTISGRTYFVEVGQLNGTLQMPQHN